MKKNVKITHRKYRIDWTLSPFRVINVVPKDKQSKEEKTMKAHFVRKACTIKDLKGYDTERASQYAIEEVVGLEPEEFESFADNLLDDFDFIAKRVNKMYMDADKVWHCILIKAKGAKDGILTESEGYDYARYSAYYPGEEAAE